MIQQLAGKIRGEGVADVVASLEKRDNCTVPNQSKNIGIDSVKLHVAAGSVVSACAG
jgi:hypothetical protein